MSKVIVKAECEACGATGLYCGFMEAKGEAVVCVRCDGTGCAKLSYTPFIKRHAKRGITTVRQSRGTFIATGVGPTGDGISYAEFAKGKMP